jgi:nicotinate dehydrogenase subunit B
MSLGISRREFAGLFVFLPAEALQPARQGYPSDFNAYLRIGPDGRVTGLVGKVEMGQGARTALAQLVAEELDVALDSVDMIMGDTDQCPWDPGTFGSQSIRIFGPVLRAAAAEARAVLLAMAAERLREPVEQLRVTGGVVTGGRERVSYADLVRGRRVERHLPNAAVKPAASFRLAGQSPRRLDGLEKVTGKATFAGDISIAGMLHARILRPPAHGAVLKSLDTAAAGAKVVRDGDLVAVLDERRDAADLALRRIKAAWDKPPAGPDDRSIFEHLLKHAPELRVWRSRAAWQRVRNWPPRWSRRPI